MVAVVYEARPNVTVDVAALCLKSGNAAVLRGSSVAAHTNGAIADLIAQVLRGQDAVPGMPCSSSATTPARRSSQLLTADEFVDLLVPRGGRGLLETVREHATVPVVIDGDGNCHVYVDASADPAMATNIIVNAKTSRPERLQRRRNAARARADRGRLAARRPRRAAQERGSRARR